MKNYLFINFEESEIKRKKKEIILCLNAYRDL
jgi:hypothetical protein